MSSLSNLVRAHRFVLEEKRQKLSDLERLHGKLVRDLKLIEKTMAPPAPGGERDQGPEPTALGSSASERRRKLCHSILEVERSIEAARCEVDEAEEELRRHEQAARGRSRRDPAKEDGGWLDDRVAGRTLAV